MGRAIPRAAWPAEPSRPQANARTLMADSSVAQFAGAAVRKHHKRGPQNNTHLFSPPLGGQMPKRVSLGENQAWAGPSLQRLGGPALSGSLHQWLVAAPPISASVATSPLVCVSAASLCLSSKDTGCT